MSLYFLKRLAHNEVAETGCEQSLSVFKRALSLGGDNALNSLEHKDFMLKGLFCQDNNDSNYNYFLVLMLKALC